MVCLWIVAVYSLLYFVNRKIVVHVECRSADVLPPCNLCITVRAAGRTTTKSVVCRTDTTAGNVAFLLLSASSPNALAHAQGFWRLTHQGICSSSRLPAGAAPMELIQLRRDNVPRDPPATSGSPATSGLCKRWCPVPHLVPQTRANFGFRRFGHCREQANYMFDIVQRHCCSIQTCGVANQTCATRTLNIEQVALLLNTSRATASGGIYSSFFRLYG